MRIVTLFIAAMVAACVFGHVQLPASAAVAPPPTHGGTIQLPPPATDSGTSIEQALSHRRSVREYRDEPLGLADVSQLLWAAQGVTGAGGRRTAPSAGALYPLETYVVAGSVGGLTPGVYRYRPGDHVLVTVTGGDQRAELSSAAPGQRSVSDAAAVLVIAGVYERTTGKYGERLRDRRAGSDYPSGVKYVHMEAGHAAQNVYLQAESLGLGTVAIGAFSEDDVRRILGLPDEERPLYLMPVGRARH